MTGSPKPGSETGTSYTVNTGTFNVSETGGPSGYTFTGYSGDCDSGGKVPVALGDALPGGVLGRDAEARALGEREHTVVRHQRRRDEVGLEVLTGAEAVRYGFVGLLLVIGGWFIVLATRKRDDLADLADLTDDHQ